MNYSWFGRYAMTLTSRPAVPGGDALPTLVYTECGGVYLADSDSDAVQKFWDWFYTQPLHLRPMRDVTVRSPDGLVILERWHQGRPETWANPVDSLPPPGDRPAGG